MILSVNDYAAQHPEVPSHMLRDSRRYVVRQGFVKHDTWPEVPDSYRGGSLRGAFGLSCSYPGGCVSIGLWNCEKWYAASPCRKPLSPEIETACEWTRRKWAIRIFDYDDGNTVAMYSDDRQQIDAVWAAIDRVPLLSIDRDLIPRGHFRTE